ncbi:MAG: hypothetical protein HC893_04940 [Chloroflexaceae bacterium]|nr:hypothetical protein [Chloroflexaceae bacterium]
MLYLIATVLCSFSIGMLMKLTAARGMNAAVVIASNYVVGAVFGTAFALLAGTSTLSMTTVLLGLGGGILWPVSLAMLMVVLRQYGLSLTGALANLSLAVPVLFGFVFLNEQLSLLAWIGILLTFVAFFLLSPPTPRRYPAPGSAGLARLPADDYRHRVDATLGQSV